MMDLKRRILLIIPTNDSATHLPFMIELLVAIIFCGIIFAMDIVFNKE